ncbi:MAG: cation diffusion facilitator family transporter [Bacteroidales bacterium]|nr:cation diffusion facilitator family transporter [Bacteroidales bacterium]
MDNNIREKQITQTSIIGIVANAFLAGFKALVGFISGSIAIVLDAVNNLTDALSSIITIIGIKLARRKPDDDHPFGHGRIEYFAAILIAAIILTAGITSLFESGKKIFSPETPDYNAAAIIIVSIAIIVKLVLGKFVKNQGEKYNSDALIASGTDASFDAIISAATLVGALITIFFNISIDGILGVVISLFICKAGIEMLMDSVSNVIGRRPDSEITLGIKATVREISGVLGAYDLVLHDYGPDSALGSIHVEVPATMTAEEIHKLTKNIQLTIINKYHVFLTIGIYAVDEKHNFERNEIHKFAMTHAGVLGTHGVFINEEQKYCSFDVLTDFTIKDKNELRKNICNQIQHLLPNYTIEIHFDTNYSN